MEVILTQDIPKLGKVGDVVKVKDGFGRNYLIPQHKAVISNSGNVQALEAQKKAIAAQAAKLMQSASAVAEKLASLVIKIEKEVGANERLFGSVTNKEIAEALAKEGLPIDRHAIQLATPLKAVGDHEVTVKLHTDVKATLKVSVVPKGSVTPPTPS